MLQASERPCLTNPQSGGFLRYSLWDPPGGIKFPLQRTTLIQRLKRGSKEKQNIESIFHEAERVLFEKFVAN